MGVTSLSECGIASQGMALRCGIASLGVALPHWVWHGLIGCGMSLVGVEWPQ